MGQAAVRRRGHNVRPAGLPARRRVPVRPAHLRPLRRLLGREGGSGGPHRRWLEHEAQVRRVEPPHRPAMAGTTVLSGDLAASIRELKARPRGELQVHGSGTLIRWLLENELLDELSLLICPVVVGQGARLFPDAGPDLALDLIDSRAFPKGITSQTYRPTGRPQYAT